MKTILSPSWAGVFYQVEELIKQGWTIAPEDSPNAPRMHFNQYLVEMVSPVVNVLPLEEPLGEHLGEPLKEPSVASENKPKGRPRKPL